MTRAVCGRRAHTTRNNCKAHDKSQHIRLSRSPKMTANSKMKEKSTNMIVASGWGRCREEINLHQDTEVKHRQVRPPRQPRGLHQHPQPGMAHIIARLLPASHQTYAHPTPARPFTAECAPQQHRTLVQTTYQISHAADLCTPSRSQSGCLTPVSQPCFSFQ